MSLAVVMGAAVGAVTGGGGGWPGWDGGCRPTCGSRRPRPHWLRRRPRRWPQPRSRQWHHWWPCCQSYCRNFCSCVCLKKTSTAVNHLSQKIAGRRNVASSRTRIVLARRFSDNLPRDVSDLCHRSGRGFEAKKKRQGCCLRLIACRPGEGRTRRTLRSSCGPTSAVFNLVYGRLYQAHRFQALFPPLPVFFLRRTRCR